MFVLTTLITIMARNYSRTCNVERRVWYKASRSGLSIVLFKWNWFAFPKIFITLWDYILEPHAWLWDTITQNKVQKLGWEGGGVVAGCMRHQTSVKNVFGFDLGCTELTNNIKMDFCANAITNTIWGMEKLAQNKHIHFLNIALRQSFNSSNILHKVRVILIDILLSLFPSYFPKDRETLNLEDPRFLFLELYISEVHRFFFLERQVLLLKASPGKSLSRVKQNSVLEKLS